MLEATAISDLVSAGIGGLVIVTVALFLKFLSEERAKATDQNTAMLLFIKDQRDGNNAANAKAAALIAEAQVKAADTIATAQIKAADQSTTTYVQVAEAMKSLTTEIRLLKETQTSHDIATQTALASIKRSGQHTAANKRV